MLDLLLFFTTKFVEKLFLLDLLDLLKLFLLDLLFYYFNYIYLLLKNYIY